MDSTKRKGASSKIIAGGLAFILVLTSFLIAIYKIPNTISTDLSGEGNAFVGEIVRQNSIEQEIPYHKGDCGFSLKFATYVRKNLGSIRVRVEGEDSGFVYVEQVLLAGEIEDNKYVEFKYAENRPQENETLRIEISSTSRPGQGVTVAIMDSDVLPDYTLKVDGKRIDADLVVRTIAHMTWKNLSWVIMALSLVCIILTLLMVFRKNTSLEKSFFVVATSLGIIYCIVLTPLSIPDEYFHYNSAFRLSNILCFQWEDVGTADARYFDFHDITPHVNSTTSYRRIYHDFFSVLPKGDGKKIDLGGLISYPFMVLPPAIGISIGRILNLNFLMTYYMGRLTNLLFYIGCIYFAIKKAPRFKLLLFMVGIMPMALHQAASYSYDSYINGMAMLLIAYILEAIESNKSMNFRKLLPIAIIGMLLAPAKNVYSPLLLLLFLIPQRLFSSKKRFYLSLGVIFLCASTMVLLFQLRAIATVALPDGTSLNWEGGINYTVYDILHNPVKTIYIFLNTFSMSIWGWFLQCIGLSFSGLTMNNEDWSIIVYGVLMLISCFRYEGEKVIKGIERCVYLITCFISVSLVMLSMMLAWTSNTHDVILGIQGRYFIPVIPLFFMSLNNRLITIRKPIEKPVIVMGVMINLYILGQVMLKSFM